MSGVRVVVIGCGMIGRSWAISFARGGCSVCLYDPADGAAETALRFLQGQLVELESLGLLAGSTADEVLGRLTVARALANALDGADHVQENAPETLKLKRLLFAELDELTPSTASIASSSSALLPSTFVPDGEGAARCLVAHPLNPPHLVPAVELVPGPDTNSATVDRVTLLMERIGQKPIVLAHELEGFVMNRLQGALLDEAMRLISTGVVSVEGVDRAVRDGLGLRWSFMGPIETIDLNAPEGVRDFLYRYGNAYRSIAETCTERVDWDEGLAQQLEHQRRTQIPNEELPDRRDWRDRQLMALAVHKAKTTEEI